VTSFINYVMICHFTEFMDRTDPTLYYLQFSCETQATYPLSIIDLGKRDDADEDSQEYLLCFSELGVFVDSEGRRSRTEDMVWTKAPKSIGKLFYTSA